MNGFARAALLSLLGASLASLGIGCWAGQDVDRTGDHVVARRGTVIVEGCGVDDAEATTLSQPSTKKVLSEIVLLCAAILPDGSIAPVAADDRSALTAQVQALHALGYRVSIATTIGTSWDAPASSSDTSKIIEAVDPSAVAAALLTMTADAHLDGVELAFPPPESTGRIRSSLAALVQAIGQSLRPARTLGVFLPPTSQSPSDVPGGDAYDLEALGPWVQRFRIMTLDYSCCGAPLGPTIDPGWAVDVQRFVVQTSHGVAAYDVAYPLYGWDTAISGAFGAGDVQTSVTYAQAESLAATTHANVSRGPTGAPYFDYTAADGTRHEVWFDDATSTLRALHAWNDALFADVGVVYYGLGAEDPRLWDSIAKEMP